MMEKYSIKDLAKYKIEKAYETLSEIQTHLGNKYLSTAMNRIYYSGFYIVSALALLDNFSTSKHKQLISYFNREYINTGKIDKNIGKIFNRAYDDRIILDYHDFARLTKSEIEEHLLNMKIFIDTVNILVQKKLNIKTLDEP